MGDAPFAQQFVPPMTRRTGRVADVTGRTRKAGRGVGLNDPGLFGVNTPRHHVRMQVRFIEFQHRREAGVGSLQQLRPLRARAAAMAALPASQL